MKQLLNLIIITSLFGGILAGCGSSEEKLPEGQSLANPTGEPKPGQQLPGAPPGVTMPEGGGR